MFSRTSATGRDLHSALERAGFYPRLVADVVEDALDGMEPLAHLVQLETHIEHTEVHRHVTVLVLTAEVMVIVHVDDQQMDEAGDQVMAQVSTETVPIGRISSVVLSFVYQQPQDYRPSDKSRELTLAISWSGGQRGPAMRRRPRLHRHAAKGGRRHARQCRGGWPAGRRRGTRLRPRPAQGHHFHGHRREAEIGPGSAHTPHRWPLRP